MERTYESLVAEAKQRSIGGYSAVCEIVNYRTGKSRLTVVSGNCKIQTMSRGPEFRGVMAQFRNGNPCK